MLNLREFNFPPIDESFAPTRIEQKFNLNTMKKALQKSAVENKEDGEEEGVAEVYFGELGDVFIAKIINKMRIEELLKTMRTNKSVSRVAVRLFGSRKQRASLNLIVSLDGDRCYAVPSRNASVNPFNVTRVRRQIEPTFPFSSHVAFHRANVAQTSVYNFAKTANIYDREKINRYFNELSYDFCTVYMTEITSDYPVGRFPRNSEFRRLLGLVTAENLIYPENHNILPLFMINPNFDHIIAPLGFKATRDDYDIEDPIFAVNNVWLRLKRLSMRTTSYLHTNDCINLFIKIWQHREVSLKQIEFAESPPVDERDFVRFMRMSEADDWIKIIQSLTNDRKRYAIFYKNRLSDAYFFDISDCDQHTCPTGFCLKKLQEFVEGVAGTPITKVNYEHIASKWYSAARIEGREPEFMELGRMILERLATPHYAHLKALSRMEKEKEDSKISNKLGIRCLRKFDRITFSRHSLMTYFNMS